MLALVAALAAVTGCGQVPYGANSAFEGERLFTGTQPRPQRAAARATAYGLVPVDRSVGVSETVPAEGRAAEGRTAAGRQSGDAAALGQAGSFTFNFEDAELSEVARAIMTDALGLNYSSGVDLSARVTISSARPVRRDELVAILENLIADQGYQLVKSDGGYRIEAAGSSAGVVDRGSAEPGYGVSIVPLRFVSVATIGTILPGFVATTDNIRVSTAENAVIIRGPSDKRQEAVDAILSFDADWMKGQTVAIFELRRATPDEIVAELDRIFASGEGGAATGAIEFKAISRLKAVLAISKNPTLIRRAQTFVRRLDLANPAADANVFVFKARHRNAADLARIVGSLFKAGGDATAQQTVGAAPAGGTATETTGSTGDDGTSGGDGSGGGGDGGSAPSFASSPESGSGGGGGGDDRFAAASALFAQAQSPAKDSSVIDLTTAEDAGAKSVRISADIANNAVVTYADGEIYEKILATLTALDAPPVQVAINVTIAEVRLNDELRYGVQYFVKSDSVGLGKNEGSASLFSEVATTLQKQLPGFNFLVGSNRNPDVIISALDAITDVEVLSSPSLVVVENETATLQVGDSVPVTVRQAQSIDDVNAPLVNQVEFRDTGIILSVTPRIGENDAVTMKISQEISAVVGDSKSLTPTFSRRRVTSAISVQSGQTVLLAGMISGTKTKGNSGIPLLKEIPVAGKLFSTTTNDQGRTELVVLIRPVVIRSGQDAQTVAQDLRSRMWTINGRTGEDNVFKK